MHNENMLDTLTVVSFLIGLANYRENLTQSDKKRILAKIHIPEITVCEDYRPHFKYWNVNVNPNRDDCCNLRREYEHHRNEDC